jgi:hypothetical protein
MEHAGWPAKPKPVPVRCKFGHLNCADWIHYTPSWPAWLAAPIVRDEENNGITPVESNTC